MSASSPQKKLLRIGLTLAGLVVGFLFITRLMPGGTGPRADGGAVLERQWDTTSVLGLTLVSPGRFRAITVPVPPEIRTSLDDIKSWGRNAGDTEMRVSRMEFREGVPLSLDGSAQGAIDAIRNNRAVSGLTFSHARMEVSGLPAVRTTSQFQVEGRPAHGEILSVLRGRTLWQVQVLGPGDEAPEIAKRVMESVQLQPPSEDEKER